MVAVSDPVSRGRAARRKGKAGELEALKLLRVFWPDAERREDGQDQDGGDVANGPEATYMEIRRRERLGVPAAMREVETKAGDRLPVLVHRPSRCPWMATLPFEELLPLLALREKG